MKRSTLIISVIILMSCGMLSAQILDQGNFILGSTLGFSSSNSKVSLLSTNVDEKGNGPSSLQISVAPKVGYFLLDNFALGLGMDFTFSSLKEPNADRTDDSDLLFGPFFRYYFPIETDIAFFAETNFGFGNSSDDQFIGEGKQSIRTNIFAIGIGPGVTILSSKGIGIEAIFKYNFARSKFKTQIGGVDTETVTKTNQFDISIGLQFYFGGIQSLNNKPKSSGGTAPF